MQTFTQEAITHFFSESIRAWNNHNLKEFCKGYAEDAIYVTPNGIVRGRNNIFEKYARVYEDISCMGILTIELLDHRLPKVSSPFETTMAAVILRWRIHAQDGSVISGMSSATFELIEEKLYITQDLSF